jgi:hypothetical protein
MNERVSGFLALDLIELLSQRERERELWFDLRQN